MYIDKEAKKGGRKQRREGGRRTNTKPNNFVVLGYGCAASVGVLLLRILV